MDKPVLVIMAAGMGSRYGGLKQMDPVDEDGNFIMDYSVFDAKRAGFSRVVFVIKPEMKDDVEEAIASRLRPFVDVEYAFQKIENLPEGFSVPEGRTKPWGTAHAVLSAKEQIHGPFCVINADDYYGPQAFQIIYDYLSADHRSNEHVMIGYKVENTLTENGTVARGVCQINEAGYMEGIVERLNIAKVEGGALIQDVEPAEFVPNGTVVSMNFWGFQPDMMKEIEYRFSSFLNENLQKNPLKCEYFLPLIPNAIIHEGTGSVRVLTSEDRWYGVTYREDKASVVSALKEKRENGLYPDHLWK